MKLLSILLTLLLEGFAFANPLVQWTSLGSVPGTNGAVYAMLQHGDSTIVAGKFSLIGDIQVNNLAIWNGSQWSAMKSDFNVSCTHLLETSTKKIYAIGYSTSGTTTIGWLEAWTPEGWDTENGDYNFDNVYDVQVDMMDRIWIAGKYYKTGSSTGKNGLLLYENGTWTVVATANVYTLAMGNRGEIYVGGSFTSMGGISVRNFAVYEDGVWSSLGGGLNSRVWDITVAESGDLFVTGSFDTAGTMRFRQSASWDVNGKRWISSFLPGDLSKVIYQDKANGVIYTSTYDGYLKAFHVKSGILDKAILTDYTGASYSSDLVIKCMTVDKNGKMLIGGLFPTIAYTDTLGKKQIIYPKNILFHDGKIGNSVVEKGTSGSATELVPGPNGNLLAVGNLNTFQGKSLYGIGIWNGSSMEAAAPEVVPYMVGTSVDVKTAAYINGTLYAGGSFSFISGTGSSTAKSVAKLDGTQWVGIPGLVVSPVYKIIGDSKGNLYAGTFNGVWVWDGNTWEELGGTNTAFSGSVYDLAWGPDGSLWAAGKLNMGDLGSEGLAKWDGTQWVAQGFGVNGVINSIAVGSDGKVYAAGDFRYAKSSGGGVLTWLYNVGIWDGMQWTAIGQGVNGTCQSIILDSQENVIVGGKFTQASNINKATVSSGNIAMWNKREWVSFGVGTDSTVSALGIDKNGKLLLSGAFLTAGGVISPGWTMLDYKQFLAGFRVIPHKGKFFRVPTRHFYNLKGQQISE
ncbi:MAG: hypothetical protein WCX75_04830 [Fibrobacteraceae bacterium]